jgi:predicted solute-binding protein
MVLSFFKRDKKEESPSSSAVPVQKKAAPARARVGFFEDLTVKPLTFGIETQVRSASLRRGSVDELRTLLANDELEAALLPTWDFLQIGGLQLIPGTCVSTYGAANMFLLCSKVLPTEITRVLVDHESFGARSLASIVLPQQMSVRPEFTRSPVPLNPRTYNFEADPHDAFLVVGDNALLIDRSKFAWVWDLSAAWAKYSEVPLVMHVWCCRRGVYLRGLPDELARTAAANQKDLEVMVTKEAERLNVARPGMELIFRHALRTAYSTVELTALRRFVRELANAQLLPGSVQFNVYRDPSGTRAPGM